MVVRKRYVAHLASLVLGMATFSLTGCDLPVPEPGEPGVPGEPGDPGLLQCPQKRLHTRKSPNPLLLQYFPVEHLFAV